MLEWAGSFGLILLNRGGGAPTTFHPRGTSVPDTSWASPAAYTKVSGWRVLPLSEILTDHRPIEIGVGAEPGPSVKKGGVKTEFPRWAIAKLNEESLEIGILAATWLTLPIDGA